MNRARAFVYSILGLAVASLPAFSMLEARVAYAGGIGNNGLKSGGTPVTGANIAPATVTVSGSTVPANGIYLPSANVVGVAGGSQLLATFSGVTGYFENLLGPVRVKVGSASTAAVMSTVSGYLDINTTAVGNVGASGPDDLISYTLPASSLTGRCLEIHAYGSTANNGNGKTVRLVWGGTTLITKALTTGVAGSWDIRATICKTGSSTQNFSAVAINSHGTTVSGTDGATVAMQMAYGTATETETGAIVIKGQSTASTSDNDIVMRGMTVSVL